MEWEETIALSFYSHQSGANSTRHTDGIEDFWREPIFTSPAGLDLESHLELHYLGGILFNGLHER